MPSLIWLFLIPLLGSLVLLVLQVPSKRLLKRIALLLSLIPLAMLVYGHSNWIGSSVQYAWLPQLSIDFYLSIDSLSLLFLYLTALVVPVSIISVQCNALAYPNFFYALILLLEALLIGFFTAKDLALFTLLFEAMLIPLYFLIALWGGAERQTAALKFLIYMIAGSVLMVAGVLSLYILSGTVTGGGTFNLDELSKIAETAPHAKWLFAIFLIAFAVKTPLFPFHGWLPDTYCQASTPGTILLSGILSKAGIYGILRIGMELFPTHLQEWSPVLLSLAIAGVLYGGLAAWMQNDFKRLLAYSSFSHVNFVLAGLFIWNQTAQSGAILQALNHGITISALFLVAGWLERRLGSTAIGPFTGLAAYFPRLCWLTLVFVLSSVALPGTNNFVGELMVLFGLFEVNPWLAPVLGLTVILSAIYMLRWMQKVYFETPSPVQDNWKDIGSKEIAFALPLVALIFCIGIYPKPVLTQIKPAVEKYFVINDTEKT